MAFLLVEIVALILLGAAAGAGLAYWWLRRGFEDVTTEYDALQQRTRVLEIQRPALDQMGRRLEAVERMLVEAPAEPLQVSARLVDVDRKLDAWSVAGVEGQNRLYEAISTLNARVGAGTELGPVRERLDAIERAWSSPDEPPRPIAMLLERMEGLEERLGELRLADLERVIAASLAATAGRLDAVERQLANLPPPDLSSIVTAVDRGFAAAPPVDLAPLLAACGSVHGAIATLPTLGELEARLSEAPAPVALASIEGRLDALAQSLQDVGVIELGELVPRFEALRTKMDALRTPDVTDLSGGVAALTATVASLRVPNFEQMSQRLATIERRMELLAGPSVDLEPVINRLQAIEGRIDAWLASGVSTVPTAPPRPEPGVLATDDLRSPDHNLLTDAVFGPPDNLEIVRGIGPKLTELLHQLGVYYYWQIADWGPEDITFVDDQLEQFQGRIERDQWVAQCAQLAAEPGAARRPRRAGD